MDTYKAIKNMFNDGFYSSTDPKKKATTSHSIVMVGLVRVVSLACVDKFLL